MNHSASSRLISLLFLLSLTWPGQAAPAPPRLGAPFAAPDGVTWLGEAPRAYAPGRITLVEFWATWSPASRLLLAQQDSLLRARPELPLQIFAISHEERPTLAAFLTGANWQALHVGSDVTRTYWQATFGAVSAPKDGRRCELPFAFIVGETEAGPGRLLWMGPLIEIYDENPRAAFDAALAAALDGSFDLSAAQEAIRQEERSVALLDEIAPATDAADHSRLAALLDELAGLRIHYMFRRTLTMNLNSLAWELAAEGTPPPEAILAASKALALGKQHGGGEESYFVDTEARIARQAGNLEEAVALQRRAIALASTSKIAAELYPALNEYLAEAGLPAEEAPAAEPSASIAWSGDLNAAGERVRGADALYVRPNPPAEAELAAGWDAEIAKLRQRFFGRTTLATPDTLTDAALASRPLLLYGTPGSNPVLARFLGAHDIAIDATGVRFGEVFIQSENPVLIAALPNPLNPALPVKLHTAFRERDALGSNRFFHGPSAIMIGHWEGEKPVVLAALDFAGDTVDAWGRRPLALGPPSLSAGEAQEDLDQLHSLLEEHYAGFADIEWTLSHQGSSWAERTADFRGRLGQRERWHWTDLFATLTDYLAPVQDAHLFMQGSTLSGGSCVERKQSFIHQWRPFFTGIRLRETSSGLRIVEAPPGFVAERLANAPWPAPLLSPHEAADGEPRLFRTLPAPSGEAEYLLGCLATEPADSLWLHLAADGPRLLARRGRLAGATRSREPWSAARNAESGWATLTLRTMSPGALADFPASADSLRTAAGLLLDLRGNGGGSDTPGMHWMQRLSKQPFDWVGRVVPWPEGREPSTRLIAIPGERLAAIAGEQLPQASEPYTRPAQVLIDKGVASSGETMVLLAGQLPGAILFGENTAGCSAYGNVDAVGPLAHSRIRLHCGRSRFVQDWVRPTREGVGFFPDYWMDTADPLTLLAERRDLRRPAP